MTDSFSVELAWTGKTQGEYSHNDAFSVIDKNGNVISWGNSSNGGDNSAISSDLTNISEIFSNKIAFAALKNDGSVVTWGLAEGGGDSSAVKDLINSNVINIYSSSASFLAVKNDGSLVTWGLKDAGGDSSEIDFTSGIHKTPSCTMNM